MKLFIFLLGLSALLISCSEENTPDIDTNAYLSFSATMQDSLSNGEVAENTEQIYTLKLFNVSENITTLPTLNTDDIYNGLIIIDNESYKQTFSEMDTYYVTDKIDAGKYVLFVQLSETNNYRYSYGLIELKEGYRTRVTKSFTSIYPRWQYDDWSNISIRYEENLSN